MTFQEVFVVAAEIHTVEDTFVTDKLDKGLDSGGDGNDGWQISSIAPMVNEGHELCPGLEKTPSVYSSVEPAEGQVASGSLMGGPVAIGYVKDLQVSKPTSLLDSDEDAEAEADLDAEAVGNSAFACPANDQ